MNHTSVLEKCFHILLLMVLLASCQKGASDEEITAETRDITESVYASLTIKPYQLYYPATLRSGEIEKVYIKEGQIVKKDDLLAEIKVTSDVQNRVTSADINLEASKDNYKGDNSLLKNLELEKKMLEDKMRLDSINLNRLERLWKQNIGTKVELDQAKLAYETSKSNLELVEKKYDQQLASLKRQYEQALSQMKAEKTQLEYFKIRSRINGKVYEVYKEEGEFIAAQQQFAELGSPSDFFIEMEIDEEDITKISIGDTVAVTLNAYQGEIYSAQLSKIYPKKNDITQTFRVEGEFIKAPEKLYSGLSGEANIVVDKRKDVLVIPANYLLEGNKVLTNDGERSVKLGVKNMEFVEVKSGIDTTTKLLKPELP